MNELPLAGEVVHLAAAINRFLDLGYELIRTIFYRFSFDIIITDFLRKSNYN